MPSAEIPARLDPLTGLLDRGDELVFDEPDSYSLEMALQLIEARGTGEVILVSMAPTGGTVGLRSALAMGATGAILISDSGLAGSDALSTAKVLAATLRRVEPDLILCATESSDGYTGTVPVQVAQLLGLPSVSFAKRVELRENELLVNRQSEEGYDEISCALPAVVTVTAGAVKPRYPSFKGIIAAKAKLIDGVSLADLDLDPSTVGVAGARQVVNSVEPGKPRAGGRVIVDDGTAEEEILVVLETWKVI